MKKNKSHLPDTPEKIISSLSAVAKRLNLDVYAVGGFVRDRLLARPFSGEIDFAVVGDAPAFAREVAAEHGLKSEIQVFKRFGTARLKMGEFFLEFAGTRRESYSENSRNPDVEPAPFEEDLARRDFTINALAVDVKSPDKIVDHFNGLEDLDHRILRTPLDPEKTFRDDPLRILRAVRFAAVLDFRIEEKTWQAIRWERARLKIVARERINEEFFKILGANPPSKGLHQLFDSGVLEVIFPELAAMAGVEQIGKFHHKDVFNHTLIVVDKVAETGGDLPLRFAALVHDIGKPKTKRFDKTVGWTFHGHEYVGQRIVQKLKEKYKLADSLTEKAAHLVRLHMRPMALQDEGVTDSAIRRLIVQAGDDLPDLLTMCRADITSGNSQKVKRYLAEFERMRERMDEIEAKDELRHFQSPVRGDEIMERFQLPEGPRVGLIKTMIEEEILEGTIPFTRDAALGAMEVIAKEVSACTEQEVLTRLRHLILSRKEGRQLPQLPSES